MSNLQIKNPSTHTNKQVKRIVKTIEKNLYKIKTKAKWQQHREDRDRKMNFKFWEYNSLDSAYYLKFNMVNEDCMVNTTVIIKMETLIKWYEKYEGGLVGVIRELRALFTLSQISTKEGYQTMVLPLKSAKEIWDDFSQHYQGLLGIRAGS